MNRDVMMRGILMMNIAVCDDNERAVNYLKNCIESSFKEYTDDFCLKSFTDGTELLKSNSREEFQVLFLDIDMPEFTGFDVAKSLRGNFSKCYIIFVTSHSDLVYKSFDFQPFNFICKNPSELLYKRIKSVVAKLMVNMKQSESIVLEDEMSGTVAVYYRNIIFIKSERHYLYYYQKDREKPIRIRCKISDIEDTMAKYDFVRIHRNFIVNMKHILDIDNSIGRVYLKVEGKQALPMSRSCKKYVNEAYTMYLRGAL